MNCVEVKEHLETFLDEEIGVTLNDEIARHLDVCNECRAEFTKLHSVSSLLKKELPASPAKRLDAKVLVAFRQHHQKPKPTWNWSSVFALKPIFTLLTICFLTSLAFLLGRMTAPIKEVTVSTPLQIVEKEVPFEVTKQVIKYVEVPTTKYVEVPVEKERIVTQTVYRTVETQSKKSSPMPRAVNPVKSVEQVDLRDFQPLGEITPKVLKKGETDEK